MSEENSDTSDDTYVETGSSDPDSDDAEVAKHTQRLPRPAPARAKTIPGVAARHQHQLELCPAQHRYFLKDDIADMLRVAEVPAGHPDVAASMAEGMAVSAVVISHMVEDAVSAAPTGDPASLGAPAPRPATVLQSSAVDWRQYKASKPDVEQELREHQRGATHLEKERFLARVAEREDSNERRSRQKKRKT